MFGSVSPSDFRFRRRPRLFSEREQILIDNVHVYVIITFK
jgi:hypothetical protein